MKKITLFGFLVFITLQFSLAQTNLQLDKSFGKNGYVNKANPDSDNYWVGMITTQDKGYIAVGEIYGLDEEGILVSKFEPNASGNNLTEKWTSTITFESLSDISYFEEDIINPLRMKEAADSGAYILFGNSTDAFTTDTSVLMRILPTGKLDPLFGKKGRLETPNNHILWDFDVTTDGKLLCMFLDLDNFSVLFARYTADGKKDATFSKAILPGDFHIYTRMERSGEDYFVSGMKIDPISFAFTNVVAKVSNQGVPVANFGKSSIATALQPQGSDDIELITNLYPATDGSVFLTGYTEQADSAVIWVEKITKAGIFDPTFALSGRHKVNNNIVDENSLIISDLVVLSNGKLVLLNLGEDLDKEVLFTKLTLLDEKGKVEKQFGEDGTLILEEKPSNSTIPTLFTNIETNTKGQIVGCGLSINNNEFFEAPIARFTPVYSVDAKDEIAKIESVAVFPNPTIDVLNLAYELKEDASVSIQLFDSQGKNVQLLSSIQSKNAGKHTEQFNLNKNIPAGLYLLKIDLGKEGTKTLKINKI